MAKKRSGNLRANFRKKHQGRVRRGDLTRDFREGDSQDDAVQSERLSGKGELTRKRTIQGADSTPESAAGMHVQLSVDEDNLLQGRVLSVHGLQSKVLGDNGVLYACAVRQVLKSLSTSQRNVIVAGDRVWFRSESRDGVSLKSEADGMIERVEPRTGMISRTSRGRQHVLVSNIDAMLIIASAEQPGIKPALIDRMILTAHQCQIEPIVIINKVDLIDLVDLQPLIGVYSSLGYRVLPTSAETGQNVDYLRALLKNRQTALAGQSGVGKSSLLNAVQPGLGLAIGAVSSDNDKGKHTTTASQLIPLADGGAVFDTPGIRQFQLWDISASEVAGLMPDLRPYVSGCRYPDCLHLAEDDCAVKNAVADARIDARRYDAYCHLLEEELM
ncbi:ribosome small subunit-dependent GTPase A [Rhodopirellula europaea]|uniref:Small ribosomal subunit biogenesis GTPase RsgA n=1 Tax=Rhodopirellula europaea SH398 TaxID=1263868 RepID=M5SAT3_9BACT|nr:ribosome small subunit-dependent GTPase A [Rhodopirellula europaea]EMI28606.1 ribosome small subunit-dependent GTPase A [Rhodopirellula europaea SH398]MCR9209963.1 ribosome small subunit-dependent GTPase A [bacterium]